MRKVLYILGLLTDADVEWLAARGTARSLVDGEILIVQGRHTQDLVLVLEGKLQVRTEARGEIALLGVGEIVGEISLVDSATASATIAAHGEGRALFVDRAELLAKLDDDQGFAARFYRALAMLLADRLRSTSRHDAAAPLDDASALSEDELDELILDRVTSAGERFNRLLRTLGQRASTIEAG